MWREGGLVSLVHVVNALVRRRSTDTGASGRLLQALPGYAPRSDAQMTGSRGSRRETKLPVSGASGVLLPEPLERFEGDFTTFWSAFASLAIVLDIRVDGACACLRVSRDQSALLLRRAVGAELGLVQHVRRRPCCAS